ncbi:DUF4383 domain-containing protein [Aerophototrophica crusticola]|uniref:DUF4383 domain-containing protein n=1 Tax=Aerophototrophica crusticola TaxID=1709002 RepID=A0A858R8I4_9PROT|nr:DUF4383 domain-containing protein [Rhodospirillaceae bacterium B3]
MRTYALIMGIVFTLVGILGFVPSFLEAPAGDPPLAISAGHGHLLGLFPVNILHNVVHLLFGLWGLAASRGWGSSRAYSRSVAVIYAVLAVMGLIPALNTTFGLVPIYGNDVWLHGLIALSAAYFGFVAKIPADTAVNTSTTTGVRTY